MYNVHVISIEIQIEVTEETEDLILKLTWKNKGPKSARILQN